ncbi:hypothetical protein SAMN05444365_106111 [Micromonospora pattaloongensis]|uniref:Uncharacterized protein n=1 Tax=Micromonospora pattaloongensis TaxID=405436 RepID=A0A1H3QSZ8_9ACTN|nr:hypothetical protein SAMN05444365_106111 [Micromonospora pattaloongensis]
MTATGGWNRPASGRYRREANRKGWPLVSNRSNRPGLADWAARDAQSGPRWGDAEEQRPMNCPYHSRDTGPAGRA